MDRLSSTNATVVMKPINWDITIAKLSRFQLILPLAAISIHIEMKHGPIAFPEAKIAHATAIPLGFVLDLLHPLDDWTRY